MERKEISEKIEQWSKFIAAIASIGAIVAGATNNLVVAIVLAIIGWILITRWLLDIWSPSIPITPPQVEKYRKYMAATGIISLSIVIWGWIGWQGWQTFGPHPAPELEIFSPNHYGIIIAEFTLGQEEREIYPGGIELRSIIFNDLERLLTRLSVNTSIAIQAAGPIKNEKDAKDGTAN